VFGRLLGSGATAKVFAAVDTASGKEVSVKVFDKAAMIEVRRSMVADGSAASEEKAVHRVRRRLLKIVSEMEISKSLDHPDGRGCRRRCVRAAPVGARLLPRP
jgi:serine/threonine protein kinase